MSKEYIEREALLERLSYNGSMNLPPMEYYREVVTKFPTADVAPIVHGEWQLVEIDHNDMAIIKCSVCNTKRFGASKYCSECGARMDGGNN